MKFIVVVDEKPKTCEGCPFMDEMFEETNKKNVLNLVDVCYFKRRFNTTNCPMTEINTVFVTDDGESKNVENG